MCRAANPSKNPEGVCLGLAALDVIEKVLEDVIVTTTMTIERGRLQALASVMGGDSTWDSPVNP
jgi:hypothetical protein